MTSPMVETRSEMMALTSEVGAKRPRIYKKTSEIDANLNYRVIVHSSHNGYIHASCIGWLPNGEEVRINVHEEYLDWLVNDMGFSVAN